MLSYGCNINVINVNIISKEPYSTSKRSGTASLYEKCGHNQLMVTSSASVFSGVGAASFHRMATSTVVRRFVTTDDGDWSSKVPLRSPPPEARGRRGTLALPRQAPPFPAAIT